MTPGLGSSLKRFGPPTVPLCRQYKYNEIVIWLVEGPMKTTLLPVVLVLTFSLLAQAQSGETRVAPSCGPDKAKFEVKTERNPHLVRQPDAGKALVYFLEDNSAFASLPRPTTRAGVDGAWVGAAQGNSFFYFSVDPGEHHLCACRQTWVGPGVAQKTAAAHFTAEPGGVYYFRVKNIFRRDAGRPFIKLEQLDSDEGQLLASNFSLSTFQLKK